MNIKYELISKLVVYYITADAEIEDSRTLLKSNNKEQ